MDRNKQIRGEKQQLFHTEAFQLVNAEEKREGENHHLANT